MKRFFLFALLFAALPVMVAQQNVNITVNPTKPQETKPRAGMVTLYGYLKVLTNELGYFETEPTGTISRINQEEQFGYNTWRIPTNDELAMLRSNGYAKKDVPYMTSSNRSNGHVILVTDKETAAVLREWARKAQEERNRRLAAERAAKENEAQRKENQYLDSLRKCTGFCDLGLPSGTQWAFQQTTDQSYGHTMLYYKDDLPTDAQWKELLERCTIKKLGKFEYLVTGPNGNAFILRNHSYFLPEPLGEFGEISVANIGQNGLPKKRLYERNSYDNKYSLILVKKPGAPTPKTLNSMVDLGLPSGTKWAYDNTRYNRNPLENKYISSVPRKSQWKELLKNCRWEQVEYGYKVTGPNGNHIYIYMSNNEVAYFCRDNKYGSKEIYSVSLFYKKKAKLYFGRESRGAFLRLIENK